MIDIATWRARIGLYNASTGGLSGGRTKVLRPPAGDSELLLLLAWCITAPLLLALGTTTVELVTLHLIVNLLLLAGDVERNPGPETGEAVVVAPDPRDGLGK